MKCIIAVFLILLSSFRAYADDPLPTLDDIPSFLSDSLKTEFSDKATEIDVQLDGFLAAAERFNIKTAEQQSDEEFEAVNNQRSAYIKAVLAYNKQLAIAAKEGKTEQDELMIPVSLFATLQEAEVCKRQIKMLNGQMSFLTKERNKLKETENGMRELVAENVTASLDLIQDMQSQSLSLLGAMVSILPMSDSAKDLIGVELGGVQIHLNDRAALSAKDKTRANEKMIDATADLKNLALTIPNMVPHEQAEAIKSATDGVIKVLKIIVRHQTTAPENINLRDDLEDSLGASLDVVQAVNPTVGVTLKATTGLPVMTAAAWALRHIDIDRAEIERALHQNATALSYYDNRIAKVSTDITYYEEKLRHQPDYEPK